MFLIDTNVLIYAHREETDLHRVAAERLVRLADGGMRIPFVKNVGKDTVVLDQADHSD